MIRKLLSTVLPFVIASTISFAQPAWTPEICVVTVDSATATYISVIWTKPVATDIDSIYVFRADSAPWNYVKIGAVDYADSSFYNDIAVDVDNKWYKYKISAVDLSGVQGIQSPAANSVWLDVVPDLSMGYFTCLWNEYQNVSNVATLVRCIWDTLGGNNMMQVGGNMTPSTISWNHTGFSQHDSSTYRLEVELDNTCSPQKANVNTTRSNIRKVKAGVATIYSPEVAAMLVRTSPNPTSGYLLLEWNATMDVQNVIITDVTGRMLQSFIPASTELNRSIDLSELPGGMYFVNFQTGMGGVSKLVVKE